MLQWPEMAAPINGAATPKIYLLLFNGSCQKWSIALAELVDQIWQRSEKCYSKRCKTIILAAPWNLYTKLTQLTIIYIQQRSYTSNNLYIDQTINTKLSIYSSNNQYKRIYIHQKELEVYQIAYYTSLMYG